WSYGVIMYEMLFNKYPVEATTLQQLKVKMQTLDINFHLGSNFSRNCFDLLIKLLNKDYRGRINWEQFFNHEWFMYWKKMSSGSNSIEKNLSDSLSLSLNNSIEQNSPDSFKES